MKRRSIAMMLLLVSIVVLAMPVVPHHHHGHQALVCMRHDLHAGCCENYQSDCAHNDGNCNDDDCTHHSGCCDGDDPCGHCCCHTGCVAHGVVQLAPDTDDVLPAPTESALTLAYTGLISLLPATLPREHSTSPYLYYEKLPDAPCVVAHSLRAPPMILVG